MTSVQLALIAAVGLPFLAAVVILALGESRELARTVTGLVASSLSALAALTVASGVAAGAAGQTVGIPLLGTRFALTADRLGVVFAVVATVLWIITTVYATGYMSHGKDKARFFAFFAICVGSAVGIALSSNLLTLFVFYEVLTLATYPLVAHNGNAAAVRGARTYLMYAIGGGAFLVAGIVWLYVLGAGADFASGGSLPATLLAEQPVALIGAFALLIAGFGVKAALFPLHGWLPAAMVAPAPVSSLLHAVAVVKAGVFAISRVVLDVYGPEATHELGVATPLALLAAFTIIFGSVRALMQDDIKKRLAYSTISQLSYIVLGVAIGTPLAAAAAIAHLAHHAALKITMFFTAGALAEELGVYKVSRMDGVGRRMPLTMGAFTVAALGIIGVPPVAGFATKWGLGIGGLDGGSVWPLAVLSLSSVLSAIYFFPMIGRAWFGTPDPKWADSSRPEGDRRLVWPLVTTAAIGTVLGVVAGAWWAPVSWSAAITGAETARAVPWRFDTLGLDATGIAFLVLALIIWGSVVVASVGHIAHSRRRFGVFLALAILGSLGLAFARDAAFFYAGFSMMALAAYGLIAHDGSKQSLDAARVYLAFTVVAEAAILAALLIGSVGLDAVSPQLAASSWSGAGVALLLLGFGIKIGTLGLHGWMPGAYMAAPGTVRAAVAGVTSSAGILGLVRFLPGGQADYVTWGTLCLVLGLGSAFYGALVGSVQLDTRVVLAYSSMSQFGLMTAGLGAGLLSGELWPAVVAAVAAYMVHHALAKAALFAGDDLLRTVGRGPVVAMLLAIPALALAGLPLTSGAVAKVALKTATGELAGPWGDRLEVLLSLAAVGTTMLMARFLFVALGGNTGRSSSVSVRRAVATVALVTTGLAIPWLIGVGPIAYAAKKSLSAYYLWTLSWPVLLGVTLAFAAWLLRSTRISGVMGSIAPADIWYSGLRGANALWDRYQGHIVDTGKPVPPRGEPATDRLTPARAIETVILSWPVASGTVAVLVLIFLLLAAIA